MEDETEAHPMERICDDERTLCNHGKPVLNRGIAARRRCFCVAEAQEMERPLPSKISEDAIVALWCVEAVEEEIICVRPAECRSG